MKIGALIAFCLAFIVSLRAADGPSIFKRLVDEADFVVQVMGVHTEKFDLGLSDYDHELQRLRPIRLPRDGCARFFANQKHKASIVVWYYAVGIEDWDPEIARTVKFFKTAGYSRIILLQNYNMDSGITVIFDTGGEFTKRQYIPGDVKK